MDVGLVCDACSMCSPLTATACVKCHAPLTLGAAPAQVACPRCRAPASSGAKACGSCGAPLVVDESRGTRSFGVAPTGVRERARLTVIRNDGLEGEVFALAGDTHLAGRANCPILFADDEFVSPVHANFRFENGHLSVEDLSTNGIFLRVIDPVKLRANQEFMVGEQVLLADVAPQPVDDPAPDGTYYFASLRRQAQLRIAERMRGGTAGRVVLTAADTFTLGRDGNDWDFPDDPYISGRHAELRLAPDGIWLHDLSSRNGTFVRVPTKQPLATGDYLFIGQQLIRVEVLA